MALLVFGSDAETIAKIKTLTALELLRYIASNPEYMVDTYFVRFGDAIYQRIEELEKEAK